MGLQQEEYNMFMTPKLSNEQRQALEQRPDGPLSIEDEQTRKVYILISQDRFERMQRLFFDDGDLTPDEMLAVARQSLDDPEGWGAPGMEEYDTHSCDSQDQGSPST